VCPGNCPINVTVRSMVRVPGYRFRDPEIDSRRCQIFLEIVGLERGPISLVRITEELLEWNSSGSVSRKPRFGRRDPLRVFKSQK
jgi:hypothetical protein